MTRVYRILRRRYARNPLDGGGAYRFGGRWSSPGTRIAYTSEHLSLAMLEYFVHIDIEIAPRDLVMINADIPDSVPRVVASLHGLPKSWRETPSPPALALIGDEFVRDNMAAVLVVPSTLAPTESNWLINPLHPGFVEIRVHSAEPFEYDSRLLARS